MPATRTQCIRRGATGDSDPQRIAAELHDRLAQPDLALVVAFTASAIDRDRLAAAMQQRFDPVPVIGCTTAGAIDAGGFRDEGVTAFSLAGPDFRVATATIEDPDGFTTGEAAQLVEGLRRQLGDAGRLDSEMFALMLIDGLSMQEERVAYALQTALGDVGLIGGSAGDGLAFAETMVLAGGQAHVHAAVVALVHCTRSFELVKTQHFEATDTKIVVTGAETEARRVTEINGETAAVEYARLIGVPPSALAPEVFARYPLMVRMVGQWYVRSIQRVDDDGSLRIYCAIDEGVVLTLGRGTSMVENLAETLDGVRGRIGEPALVICCDCILRRLEAEATGIAGDLARLFDANHVVGFSTYGEQYGAVHVNQTFTGIAIAGR